MTREHDEHIYNIARTLRQGPPYSDALSEALVAIHDGRGSELFQALYELERSSGEGNDLIARIMRHVEPIVDANVSVGVYLMGRLFASAWRTPDHSVYESIQLWMQNIAAPEASDILLRLAGERLRPALKKLCLSWAATIRAKASHRDAP